jgi:hypothetical protein
MKDNFEDARDNLLEQVREDHRLNAALGASIVGEHLRRGGELAAGLEPVKIDGGGVLIVERQGRIRWPSPLPEALDVVLPAGAALQKGPGTAVVPHKQDRGRLYLASWAPVASQGPAQSGGLVVLVVQAEAEALSSLNELVARARRHAFWLAVLLAVLAAGSWTALIARRAYVEGTVYV